MKKKNLITLKCTRCDFTTKNRYIYLRHKNRCLKAEDQPDTEAGEDTMEDDGYVDVEESMDEGSEANAIEASIVYDDDETPAENTELDTNGEKPKRRALPKIRLKLKPLKSGGHAYLHKKGSSLARNQPKRNYSCEHCSFKTTKSKAYLHHQVEKHGASFNIFGCTFCEYGCRWKHKLLRHMKIVHKVTGKGDDIQAELVRLPTKKNSSRGTENSGKDQEASVVKKVLLVQKPAAKGLAGKNFKKPASLKIKVGGKAEAKEYILDLTKSEKSPHFKCKLCIYSSRMKARVFNHVMSCHVNAKVFSCKICSFSTTRKTDLYAHKAEHDGQKIFSCEHCTYSTVFKPNYDRHMVNHLRQFRLKCKFCSFSSDNEGAVKRHVMYNHPESEQEMADITVDMSDSISEVSSFTSAKETGSDEEDDGGEGDEELPLLPGFNRCKYCGFLGMSDEELDEHIATHKRVAFYPCQICKLKYKRSGDLNRHMKQKHNIGLKEFIRRQGTDYQVEISPSGEITIPAIISTKPRNENADLDDTNDMYSPTQEDDDHEIQFRSNTDEQPLDLSMSSPEKKPGKNSPAVENLQCSYCSYVAKWPSDLRRHSMVHTVEKRFKCPHCNRKYKYGGDLNVHIRRDHKVEPESPKLEKQSPVPKRKSGMFKCPNCPYSSPFRSEVERHARSHTDAKPHNCILCFYQSHWKGDVKRHIQKHHPKVLESTVPVEEFIETSFEETGASVNKRNSHSPDVRRSRSNSRESTPVSTVSSIDGKQNKESRPKMDSKSKQKTSGKESLELPENDDSLKEPIFKCKYCEFTASAASKLKAHVITHVNLKQWKCPVCPRRSNWKWDVRKHLLKDHPKQSSMEVVLLTEAEAKATIQDYILKSTMPKRENHLDNMNIAEAQDELKFPYRCSACGFNSAYRWEVSKHIRATHPMENCSMVVAFSTENAEEESQNAAPVKEPSPKMELKKILKQPTLKQTSLKRQLIEDNNAPEESKKRNLPYDNDASRPYMCGDCGKCCTNHGDVKKHYYYIHPDKEIKVIYRGNMAETTPKPQVSTIAPSPSKAGKSLESRYSNPKNVGYIKPFMCSVCHRRSNWKWDINKHMRDIHAGESAHLIILPEDEARATLATYVAPSQQHSQHRAKSSADGSAGQKGSPGVPHSESSPGSPQKPQVIRNLKQFKCSACLYRSDWRSDTQRHIRTKHGRTRASLIILDPDHAKATLNQYLYKRKIARTAFFSKSPRPLHQSKKTEGVSYVKGKKGLKQVENQAEAKGWIWKCKKCSFSHKERHMVTVHLKTHKLKPFNCKICGHESNYRSALYRHLRAKHNTNDFSNCLMTMRYVKEGRGKTEMLTDDISMTGSENMDPIKSPELEMEDADNSSASGRKRVFHCKMCEYQTTWRSCVIRHLKEKHKSTDFTQCGIKTVDLDSLRKKKGRKKYHCTKCPYVTEKQGLLKFHMANHKPKPGNRYKCKYCPYYVCAKRLLHQHLRVHTVAAGQIKPSEGKSASVTPKRYQCEKCPFKTGSKNDILYHKQFHRPRPSATFKCDFCDYWVTHRRLLKQHYRMHKNAEAPCTPVKQPIPLTMVSPSPCKSEATDASWFYSPVDAASIKQQVISSKITRSLPAPGQSPVKSSSSPAGYVVKNGVFRKLHHCRYCPYVNLRGRNLRLHEKMHGWRLSDKFLFQCTQCNYMVGSKGLLSHHMKVHTKGYGMDPNDNTTAELENLEGIHVEGDEQSDRSSEISDQIQDTKMDTLLEIARFKKYACEKCPYASAKRNHFERHLELHGSKQRYICDFCDYSVPSNNLLTQHQKLHLLPNPNLLAVQSVTNLQHLPEITADVAVASFLSSYNPEKEKTINVTHDHMELYENHPDPPEEPKKLYRCDRCPYANVRRDHLLAHLKYHMIRSELACPYCDYSVGKQHLLAQHIKVHFSPLPEFSEWLAQTGSKERETNKKTAEVGKPDRLEETSKHDVNGNEPLPPENNNSADVTIKEGDEDSKPVPASSDMYVCQYCDRELATSEALVSHEMQHLVGNYFEATQPVELHVPTVMERPRSSEDLTESTATASCTGASTATTTAASAPPATATPATATPATATPATAIPATATTEADPDNTETPMSEEG